MPSLSSSPHQLAARWCTMYSLSRKPSGPSALLGNRPTVLNKAGHNNPNMVKIYIRLLSLMGFSWFFGFSAAYIHEALMYPFVFFSTLQVLMESSKTFHHIFFLEYCTVSVAIFVLEAVAKKSNNKCIENCSISNLYFLHRIIKCCLSKGIDIEIISSKQNETVIKRQFMWF